MRRWLSTIMPFLALLLASSVASAQTAPSPHWPSARTSGWNLGLNGMATSEKLQIYDWAARHYDFLQSIDGSHLSFIREINPTCLVGRYNIFTCAIDGTPVEQAIEARAAALGRDVEDAYLHYSLDKSPHPLRASSDISAQYPWLQTEYDTLQGNYKVYVPGWDPANDKNADGYVDDAEFSSLSNPNATARRRSHARHVEWSWAPPQWQINLGAFDIVKVIVEMEGAVLAEADFDMLWWDSVSGWLWTEDKVEYPKEPGGDALAEYQADIASMIRYSRELYGSQVRIGGNSCVGYWIIDQELDVSIREGMFTTWQTARDWEGALAGGIYGPFNPNSSYWKSREAHKIQLLQHQYNLLYYIADRPEVWERDRIFGVAAYYLLQNPGYDYWAAYRGFGYWPTVAKNEQYWSHSLEVDIGQPTDVPPSGFTEITPWGVWVFAEGADPGHPDYPDITKCRYKVYAREYEKGLVLLKPKSGNDPSRSTFADNTATTHSLGGMYQMVQDDGTLGSAIDSITLRNGEGAILVSPRPVVLLERNPSAIAPDDVGGITYTVTAENPLPNVVTNVKIEGRVPQDTTYVDGTATLDGIGFTPELVPNPENANEQLIRVYVAQIASGGTVVFQYRVKVTQAKAEAPPGQ